MKRIFLDTAAGTEPNPSSLHREGMAASRRLEMARSAVATVLSARPEEIIFTSGGTEGNNLAVLGLPDGAIIVSAIEHPSVLAPAWIRAAAARGRVLIAPVDRQGIVKLKELEKLLSLDVSVVSIMYANNEIGTIQPVKEIAKLIRKVRKQFNQPEPYFHLDACQAPRFLSLDVRKLGVDLMTINGGKIYGPRGSGVLYVRRGVPLKPLLWGGGQENGRRAGTEDVNSAVGLAQALTLAQQTMVKEGRRLTRLRDRFLQRVISAVPQTKLNGHPRDRLPHHLNLSFAGVSGEQVVLELDAKGIAVSTGSACAIPKQSDSYVIIALGQSKQIAQSSVRFTLGRETTWPDLEYTARTLASIIRRLRTNHHAYAADLSL